MRAFEFLTEAKKPSLPSDSTPPTVAILICDLFIESYKARSTVPGVKDRLKEFITQKMANPTAKFGKDDKPFVDVIPATHAKLTSNISIVYTLSGANPKLIKLYGVFTHDDIGTGQPPNQKRQKNIAAKMSNQTFTQVDPARI